jgi:hypothetical protein
MTTKETLEVQLHNTQDEMNKWISVLYLIITALGEKTFDEEGGLKSLSFKLENCQTHKIPSLEYPLVWDYDKTTDILTLTIQEEKKSIIEMV